MDIKATVEKTVKKLMDDPKLLKKFEKEPVKVIEELIGVDLPDDQIEKVVDAVKAKINLDSLSSKLGGLGGLFGRK